MAQIDLKTATTPALAYLGDCAIEICVREDEVARLLVSFGDEGGIVIDPSVQESGPHELIGKVDEWGGLGLEPTRKSHIVSDACHIFRRISLSKSC